MCTLGCRYYVCTLNASGCFLRASLSSEKYIKLMFISESLFTIFIDPFCELPGRLILVLQLWLKVSLKTIPYSLGVAGCNHSNKMYHLSVDKIGYCVLQMIKTTSHERTARWRYPRSLWLRCCPRSYVDFMRVSQFHTLYNFVGLYLSLYCWTLRLTKAVNKMAETNIDESTF